MLNIIYVLLLLALSFLAFVGGSFLPIGIVFIAVPIFAGVGISAFYVKKSVNDRRFRIMALYIIPIVISVAIGVLYDSYRTSYTRNKLHELKAYVERYAEEYRRLPDFENEDFLKKYSEYPRLYDDGNGKYRIEYRDAAISSEDDVIGFRPRP